MTLEPTLQPARRKLTSLLARLGRSRETLELCRVELATAEGSAWMNDLLVQAMEQTDLRAAGELAFILAALRWGSQWYPPLDPGRTPTPPERPPEAWLSISKLRHDADQFRYLRARGVLGAEFDAVIRGYEAIADRLAPLGINARAAMEPEDEQRIGHVYNRIVHIRDTPRIGRALSSGWDAKEIERRYLLEPPGIVVIDGFLSEPALTALRAFCLESTVWSGNRYADGRLGAFFFAGFNCPLLLQIAEEIRDSFPQVIGSRHPLRQLWGFKNSPYLPGDSTIHADFAAVNVNFWLTPESANLDDGSGGLVVYDVVAPITWDFTMYNESLGLIRDYLRSQHARSITIPYRQNRAIIFNSDLFHATAQVRFRPEYENRRINVTMLYGDRERDDHHPMPSGEDLPAEVASGAGGSVGDWRSAAFARSRRLR